MDIIHTCIAVSYKLA